MRRPKAGLLPLYLSLYDELVPEARERHTRFVDEVVHGLESNGLTIVQAPICCEAPEFRKALNHFETSNVVAVVTLHLSYSPSLESAEIMASTSLPLIVCDTTPTFDYGPTQDPAELLFNHGIHGVQDFCNLLTRYGKPFHIEAGYYRESGLFQRIAERVRGAAATYAFRNGKVGTIGQPFPGMGDFFLPPSKLHERFGATVLSTTGAEVHQYLAQVTEHAIEEEVALDRQRFAYQSISSDTHRQSVALELALRAWIAEKGISAFTFNFGDITRAAGFETVPFLAASKAMADGIGYAGEGDILDALFLAALFQAYDEITFTEMFCPDWKGDRIFLSHMGEVNWKLLAEPPDLLEKDYSFSDTGNPAYISGCLKGGPAMLV